MKSSKYRFFAYTLLFVMVFNVFKYQVPQVQYRIFKDYIAKNLCENKDKPNSCCHGKCFLKKQLKLADESSSNNENSGNKKIQLTEVKEFLRSHILTPKPDETTLFRLVNPEAAILQGHASAIFVPPKS